MTPTPIPTNRDEVWRLIETYQECAYSWGYDDGVDGESTPPAIDWIDARAALRIALGLDANEERQKPT